MTYWKGKCVAVTLLTLLLCVNEYRYKEIVSCPQMLLGKKITRGGATIPPSRVKELFKKRYFLDMYFLNEYIWPKYWYGTAP